MGTRSISGSTGFEHGRPVGPVWYPRRLERSKVIRLKCGCVLITRDGHTKVEFCKEGFRLSMDVDKAVLSPGRSSSAEYERARTAYLQHVLSGPVAEADHLI